MLGAAEDQRALDRLRSAGACASSAVFSAWLTMVTLWSMRSTVVAAGVTDTSAGLVRYWSASSLIALRHGRREEQGLALGRDQRDDPLQRVDEAEVEHLVGLVEDEDLELAQGERALVDEVEQAAGRGDEDVEAARDGAHALARWERRRRSRRPTGA